MHRIITKAGGERVSEAAANELQKVLEQIGSMIAKEALVFMQYAQYVRARVQIS
jgi:histone H3/H4